MAMPFVVSDARAALEVGAHGLANPKRLFANLGPAALVEQILARQEGLLTESGAIVAYTGKRTGRSPQDRFLVAEPASKSTIAWGAVNRPMEPAVAGRVLEKSGPISRAANCSCLTAGLAPMSGIVSRSASSPTRPGTRSLPAACYCGRPQRNASAFVPT